ncbi:hypothetical protein SAMN02745164_00471 [Marinitoga hydrogenitolerans DSM 16785]|uniref:DUF5666 domain-containing protein n=1 Tax=Marinitoga hydrogenitolerans (strain DSM 16785 / JCM 12826 / AT1271) TaxID=1122195 RepID=A0A1M4TQ40_MARH1|nr:hypothetical protein [Marinitoga hydrogenitolerans]SHE46563.1 hypothetical protein SAMN02745164_00471 [Marinitoga hydrogenitolerans DSM 16785]
MKKFLTVLLLGGLMVGSIFAFNANAPRVYQDSTAPMYQEYNRGVHGGYMFSEEDMITVKGTIDSIEEEEEFPGIKIIKVKTEDGEIVEVHANAYFATDIETGKEIELTGWKVVLNGETIFKTVESKIDGEEVLLNGYRGAARGMYAPVNMYGYDQTPFMRKHGNFGNRQMPGYAPQYQPMKRHGNFGYNQMPGYVPQYQPMPRGR